MQRLRVRHAAVADDQLPLSDADGILLEAESSSRSTVLRLPVADVLFVGRAVEDLGPRRRGDRPLASKGYKARPLVESVQRE